MRWDLPLRILPMLAGPTLLVALTPLSSHSVGLAAPDLGRQVLLAAALGPPMGWLSWWYRRRYVRRVVVPTSADNLLQCLYYVGLNAPAEELLFRGLLLGWLSGAVGIPLAWGLSTLAFGLYHIPARWGWPAVAGVACAGGLFGLLFLLARGSLLLPTVVHAFATCGFLSAGPWVAYNRESRRRQAPLAPQPSALGRDDRAL
jgi:Zn-dependent protease with chaperone function